VISTVANLVFNVPLTVLGTGISNSSLREVVVSVGPNGDVPPPPPPPNVVPLAALVDVGGSIGDGPLELPDGSGGEAAEAADAGGSEWIKRTMTDSLNSPSLFL
jgi:hypothetical protein